MEIKDWTYEEFPEFDEDCGRSGGSFYYRR